MLQQQQSFARLYDSTSSCSNKRPSIPAKQQLRTVTSGVSAIRSLDVVCARGRKYFNHHGNQVYRKLIDVAKKQYSQAPKRLAKSLIVSQIIDAIQEGGRFIKLVGKGKNSTIEICEEVFIREKVTQSLRDTLSFKYSSSTKRKKERKVKDQEIFHADIDKIVHSNIHVSKKIQTLEQRVRYVNHMYANDVPDETMLQIFDQANLELLKTIKKYQGMMNHTHCMSYNNNTNTDIRIESTTILPVIIENSSNHCRNHHHTNHHFETSVSSSICSSGSSVSSSYTNASSANTSSRYDEDDVSFTSERNTTTTTNINSNINNNNYDDGDHVLDFDTPFMFLDDLRVTL